MTWVEEVTLSALTLKIHNPVAQSVKFLLVKLGTESIWPDGVKSQTVVPKKEVVDYTWSFWSPGAPVECGAQWRWRHLLTIEVWQ